MAAGPRLKSLLAKLSLSVISTAIFLGAAEWIARTRYTPQKEDPSWLFEYDKDKVYRLRPNLNTRFASRRVVTNSLGYRDAEIPIRKPAGTTRILVLGDSVTFGHGVDGNRTFAEQLELLLRRRNRARRFDVINTGVPGNATFQEYFDFVRGLRLEPDLVILQFTPNDVTEPYQVYKRFGGTGKDYHDVEDVPYLDYILSRYSGFYLFLKETIQGLERGTKDREKWRQQAREREIYRVENLVMHPEDPKIAEAWNECLDPMQKMVDTAREKKIPFILIATPFSFQLPLTPRAGGPEDRLRRFASRNGVRFIDLLAPLQNELRDEMTGWFRLSPKTPFPEVISYAKAAGRDPLRHFWNRYFLDHTHLNDRGHEYVADLLYPEVASALRLPRKGPTSR